MTVVASPHDRVRATVTLHADPRASRGDPTLIVTASDVTIAWTEAMRWTLDAGLARRVAAALRGDHAAVDDDTERVILGVDPRGNALVRFASAGETWSAWFPGTNQVAPPTTTSAVLADLLDLATAPDLDDDTLAVALHLTAR